MEKRFSKAAVEQSKYDSPQGRGRFDETHSREVKGKRESEAGSLKYDSPSNQILVMAAGTKRNMTFNKREERRKSRE